MFLTVAFEVILGELELMKYVYYIRLSNRLYIFWLAE